jgi:hypothetical protein
MRDQRDAAQSRRKRRRGVLDIGQPAGAADAGSVDEGELA